MWEQEALFLALQIVPHLNIDIASTFTRQKDTCKLGVPVHAAALHFQNSSGLVILILLEMLSVYMHTDW